MIANHTFYLISPTWIFLFVSSHLLLFGALTLLVNYDGHFLKHACTPIFKNLIQKNPKHILIEVAILLRTSPTVLSSTQHIQPYTI